MKNLAFKIRIGIALFSILFSSNLLLAGISHRNPSAFAPQQYNFVLPASKVFDKDKILDDDSNRISPEFKIPPEFRDRVSFWFDVYTKYSAQEQVIHHCSYPWIVFRVVDVLPILTGEGNKWAKIARAEKYTREQVKGVKRILLRLAHYKQYTKLESDEQEIFDQIQKIPNFKPDGSNAKKIILQALHSLRTQVGQKDFIENGLSMSSLYMGELEKIFAQKDLPLELTRLPFVESSFNVSAVSKVGASGVWQVMPYIGRKFLMMNGMVDERNSPIKSAIVAAYILKQNKHILKTWPLALTAYNHGTGSLVSIIRKQHSADLNYLIKHSHPRSFGFASQNFYASFLAVLHAEKYKDQIFSDYKKIEAPDLVRVRLTRSLGIQRVLKITGLTAFEFRNLNLDIRKYARKLPSGYVVYIPQDAAEALIKQTQTFAKLVDSTKTKSL